MSEQNAQDESGAEETSSAAKDSDLITGGEDTGTGDDSTKNTGTDESQSKADDGDGKGNGGDDKESSDGKSDDTSDDEGYAEFTLPESMEIDASAFEAATPLLKELGATQEQAQKLVDIAAGLVEQAGAFDENQLKEAVQDAIIARRDNWTAQTIADESFGGAENLDKEVLPLARQAIKRFAPDLMPVLKETGFGSHPEFVRFASEVGKLFKEDAPETGGKNTSSEEKDFNETLYN